MFWENMNILVYGQIFWVMNTKSSGSSEKRVWLFRSLPSPFFPYLIPSTKYYVDFHSFLQWLGNLLIKLYENSLPSCLELSKNKKIKRCWLTSEMSEGLCMRKLSTVEVTTTSRRQDAFMNGRAKIKSQPAHCKSGRAASSQAESCQQTILENPSQPHFSLHSN